MRMKITGYADLGPTEYDPGPGGPLTEEAYVNYLEVELGSLDDLTFEVLEEDENDG